MNRSDVQAWLDRYVEAWQRYEPDLIAALFSEEAVYRYHPWEEGEEALVGREAIVASWLGGDRDEPGTWDARYEPFAVDGDRAVAIGWSHYVATDQGPERTYWNCFLLRFSADGRCAEFTEYYMKESRS